jgi:hypothetical protein
VRFGMLSKERVSAEARPGLAGHQHPIDRRPADRRASPATSRPRRPGACVDPRPGGLRHRLAFRTFRCYPRVVEGSELNQISETQAERRAELVASPRKVAKPTKARPEQIDPNRLSKAIQYLKDHSRR